MSKSLGNVVDPNVLLDRYGKDAVRYYLLRTIPLGSDGQYSEESFTECFNAFLANVYGNLVHRTAAMISKYFAGAVPVFKGASSDRQREICAGITAAVANYEKAFDAFETSNAIIVVDPVLANANKYIEEMKPWELAKMGKHEELANALALVVHSIRVASILLAPVLCDAAAKALAVFGFPQPLQQYASVHTYAADSTKVAAHEPLFVRIERAKA